MFGLQSGSVEAAHVRVWGECLCASVLSSSASLQSTRHTPEGFTLQVGFTLAKSSFGDREQQASPSRREQDHGGLPARLCDAVVSLRVGRLPEVCC